MVTRVFVSIVDDNESVRDPLTETTRTDDGLFVFYHEMFHTNCTPRGKILFNLAKVPE